MKKWPWAVLLFLALAAATVFVGVRMRFPVRHLDIVREHAGDLDPALIMAVIMAESSFRPHVESHAGAQGLMQLMPTTAAWVAELMGWDDFDPQRIFEPEVNIALGSFYLNWLVRYFGDEQLAIAAYNAGQGNVRRWLADPRYSGDGYQLDDIPFPETNNYVNRVNFNRRVYRILLWLRR